MYKKLLIFFLLFPLSASARINIYLIPEVETDKKNITLSDIAGIDGDQNKYAEMIEIPRFLYKDFIIDRKELNDYLSSCLNQSFAIFGNGAKIRFAVNDEPAPPVTKEVKPVLIKKGESVELLIRNKCISIVLKGRSLQSGDIDDEISVRINNGRVLKGRPLSAGKVEISL